MSFLSNTIHFDFFTPKKTVVFLCLYPLFSVKYRKGVYIQNTTVFLSLTICFDSLICRQPEAQIRIPLLSERFPPWLFPEAPDQEN